MLIIFTTVPEISEGEEIARALVKERLAACVQILPRMTSCYFWDGKVRKDDEHLLLIKTLGSRYAEIEEWLLEHHSYDEPEIVAVEASKVSAGYLEWLTRGVAREPLSK